MNTTYENTTNINEFLTAFVKGAVEVFRFQDGTDGIQVDTKSTGLCEVRTFVINIPGEEPIHELRFMGCAVRGTFDKESWELVGELFNMLPQDDEDEWEDHDDSDWNDLEDDF